MRKINEQLLKMSNAEIEEKILHFSKIAIDINNEDIEEILVSNKFAFEEKKKKKAKYFIGYKNDKYHYSQSFHKQSDISIKLKKLNICPFLSRLKHQYQFCAFKNYYICFYLILLFL